MNNNHKKSAIKIIIQKSKIAVIDITFFLLLLSMLVIFLYGILNWDSVGTVKNLWSDKRILFIILTGIAGLLFSTCLFHKILANCKKCVRYFVYISLTVLAVAVQIFIIFRYRVQLGWDNTDVLTSAISIISKDKALFSQNYFEIYKHQRCFLIVTTLFVRIAHGVGISYADMPLVLSLISAFFMDGAMFFTYGIVRKLRGPEGAEKLIIWLLINPGLYLWCAYYYTTNMSLFTITVTIFGFIKVWKKEESGYFNVFWGMLCCFGIQYRATLVIVLIGVFIMALISRPCNWGKKAGGIALGMLVMYVVLRLLYGIYVPINEENAFPVSHWLMMGAQGVGTYNDEDVYFTATQKDMENRSRADWKRYTERLESLGIDGVMKLCVSKMTYSWSYGNHEYKPECQRYDALYDRLWGTKNKVILCYEQIYHLALMVLIMITTVINWYKSVKKSMDFIFLPLITLLGAILFYILWETNPYYSVGFLSVMLICSCDGITEVEKVLEKGRMQMFWNTGGAICLAGAAYGIFSAPYNNMEDIPVITQSKTCDVLFFDGENDITQSFVANRSFNKMELWLTKEKRKEDSTGIYQISLSSESRGVIYQEIIYNQDVYRTIEFTGQFDKVKVDKKETFTITVSALKDDDDNRMGICYYNLPVDAYLFGEIEKDGQKIQGDFLLRIYLTDEEEEE